MNVNIISAIPPIDNMEINENYINPYLLDDKKQENFTEDSSCSSILTPSNSLTHEESRQQSTSFNYKNLTDHYYEYPVNTQDNVKLMNNNPPLYTRHMISSKVIDSPEMVRRDTIAVKCFKSNETLTEIPKEKEVASRSIQTDPVFILPVTDDAINLENLKNKNTNEEKKSTRLITNDSQTATDPMTGPVGFSESKLSEQLSQTFDDGLEWGDIENELKWQKNSFCEREVIIPSKLPPKVTKTAPTKPTKTITKTGHKPKKHVLIVDPNLFQRFFEVRQYDSVVKSYLTSSDRRIRSINSKLACKISMYGPINQQLPGVPISESSNGLLKNTSSTNSLLSSSRSKRDVVIYIIIVSADTKEKLDKCVKIINETYPMSCLVERSNINNFLSVMGSELPI